MVVIIKLLQNEKWRIIHIHNLCLCYERWVRSTHFLAEHTMLRCSSSDMACYVICYQPMCTPWLVLLITQFTLNVQHTHRCLVVLLHSNLFYSYMTSYLYKKLYCLLCAPFMRFVEHMSTQANTHAKCSPCVIVIKPTCNDGTIYH